LTLLGVMVDLGWPWWVTTLIALSVSTACTVVFVMSRDVAVRAVVATLAVQGIVLAVVAPFLMKENSSGSTAMHASPPAMKATSLTRAEFARRADANCTAVNKAFVAAGNPQTPAAIGRKLDVIMPAFSHGLARQGALAPPPAERATAQHWMNAMSAFADDYEALGHAGTAHDAAGVKAAGAKAAKDAALSARFSKQLGLKVCFS